LATGDALGTTVEFESPGTFEPLTDMVGGGPFGLKPGQWTDDTSMALCLAASVTETKAFDARDQMERYVRWWRKGYMSSTGQCFDIGSTTQSALASFARSGDPWSGPTHPRTAGNGSLMRLAPVPIAFAHDPLAAIERAADSSRTTHGAHTAVDACRYYAALIVGALRGEAKDVILAPHYSPVAGAWEQHPLHPEIAEIAAGSFKHKQPPAIIGSGFVVKSLEAALWAFYTTSTFRDGVLRAVNLGDDADTTAAVYGQLAGAYYGVAGIPEEWLRQIHSRDLIEGLADRLCTAVSPEAKVRHEAN
jgi:ADP-ribosylglycohydrolase